MSATKATVRVSTIKALLSTYKPDHGREFVYDLNPPIVLGTKSRVFIGKLKEFSADDLTMTVIVSKIHDAADQVTIRVTTTGRNRMPKFYKEVLDHLSNHLWRHVMKDPTLFEPTIQSLIRQD